MKSIFLGIVICILIALGIGITLEKRVKAEPPKHQIEQSQMAASELGEAIKQAEANNPNGFLRLYDIATNDLKYTVEYSEVAEEELYLLLYSKTELWINTFSKVELEEFKVFVRGIEVSQFPEGVTSNEKFKEDIFKKLEKIKGDNREMELINHIFGLYDHHPVK